MTTITHADSEGDELRVEPAAAMADTGYAHTTNDGVYIPKADAPAVALAILEAAGWTGDALGTAVTRATYLLGVHTSKEEAERRAQAEEAARKAEEEALDREALELLNAATESHYPTIPDNVIGSVWRRAARRARELHS